MSRTYPALLICAAALGLAACGDDSDEGESTTVEGESGTDLTAVKSYLTDHSAVLAEQTEALKTLGQEYYDLAESVDFDYEALLKEHGDEVERDPRRLQGSLRRRQPRLRGDGGDRRGRAAPRPVRRRHRRRLRRLGPGERGLLQPRAAERRDPEAAGQPVLPDRDRALRHQPRLPRRGRSRTSTATARWSSARACPTRTSTWRRVEEFDEQADDLDADAQAFEPTPSDALTAITVMTPTMSEYFEAWKNSRFVAGEDAERAGLRRHLAALRHRRHPRGDRSSPTTRSSR